MNYFCLVNNILKFFKIHFISKLLIKYYLYRWPLKLTIFFFLVV